MYIQQVHTEDMNTNEATATRDFKLPGKHAHDWFDRLGEEKGAEIIAQTKRTITLRLSDEALRDLISDAVYYSEEMEPSNTGDIDYRPAARRCLAALDRQCVKYTRRSFIITLVR